MKTIFIILCLFFSINWTVHANENSDGIYQITNQVNEKTKKTYELKIPKGEIIETTPVMTGIGVPFLYLFSYIFFMFIFFIVLRTYIYLYSFIKYKFFNNEKIHRKIIQDDFLKLASNYSDKSFFLVTFLIIGSFIYFDELPLKLLNIIM